MNKKDFAYLLDAICTDDLSTVTKLCEDEKQFRGSLFPSPLSLALHTKAVNPAIVKTLLEHGFQPSLDDINQYHSLPSLKESELAQYFTKTTSASKSLRNWFRKTQLSSSQISSLWKGSCERGDIQLSQYLLSIHSLKSTHFYEALERAKQHKQHELLASLVTHPHLTPPHKRDLLFFAVENSNPFLAKALITEQQPKGFFANIRHSLASFFTNLRYGHPSIPLKKALHLAIQKKDADMVEALLSNQKFTLTKEENLMLLGALCEEKTPIPSSKQESLVHVLLKEPRMNRVLRKGNKAIVLAAEKGNIEVINALLQGLNPAHVSTTMHEAIRIAAAHKHFNIVTTLLSDSRIDPAANNNALMRWAATNGYLEAVETLLKDKRVDPAATSNEAIRLAAAWGHFQIVKTLLKDPRIDPAAEDNQAIRSAAKNGHAAVVKLLLTDPRIDPTAVENQAIRYAAGNGHFKVVKRLLKDSRVDPTTYYNYAINNALKNKHTDVVRILLKDGRATPGSTTRAIATLAVENQDFSLLKMLLQSQRKELQITVYPIIMSIVPKLAQNKDKYRDLFKFLFASLPQEQRKFFQNILGSFAPQANEKIISLECHNAILSLPQASEEKQIFKTLKIGTKHLIGVAKILSDSETQEMFTQKLSTFLKEEDTIKNFRELLTKAARILTPIVSAAKTFPNEATGENIKPLYGTLLASKLVPFISEPLVIKLFNTLNEHLHNTLNNSQKERPLPMKVRSLAEAEIDQKVKTLAPALYQQKTSIERSWANTVQKKGNSAGIKM